MPVEQPRDELNVVDAVRVAAVDRLVASDQTANPHRSSLASRPPRFRRRDDYAGCPLVLRERGGEHVRSCGPHVEPPPFARRDDPHLATRRGREAGVAGRPIERSCEAIEIAVGSGTTDSKGRRAVPGQREHQPQLVRGDRPVDAAPAHPHGP